MSMKVASLQNNPITKRGAVEEKIKNKTIMKKIKRAKIGLVFSLLALIIIGIMPLGVSGEIVPIPQPQLLEPQNPITPRGGGLTLDEIGGIIDQIARFFIATGVIIAVIFIIWGGITWIAAGGNDEQLKKARTRVWNGILGGGIILAVGVILATLSNFIARTFFA